MEKNFFTIDDEIYPENLKNIFNPPKKIYYKGNLNLLKSERLISIVGTRNNSSYGEICCENIVRNLIKSDVVIVSGFARGIDSIAHKICLDNLGKTIAVVASGLDIIYPASNISLWKKIEKEGLILSEYDYGIKPFKQNFPQRNRIIAALSRATIIIESKKRGGSLISADMALEMGKDVYAVPGNIHSENSIGCNELIRDSKAKLLISADEILEEYNWKPINFNNTNTFQDLNDIQQIILNTLNEEKSLDSLINEMNVNLNIVLTELMELEIMGKIKSLPAGKYIKIF